MTDENGVTETESASESPTENDSSTNQQMDSGESSAPVEQPKSFANSVPQNRFNQVIGERNEARNELDSSAQALQQKDAKINELNDKLSQLEQSTVSEGIAPFTGDIKKIVTPELKRLHDDNAAMRNELNQLQQYKAVEVIAEKEKFIREKLSGKRGRRTYDEVFPQIEAQVKQNPNLVYEVDRLYKEITDPDVAKYVESLEAKLGVNKTEQSIANAVPGTVSTDGTPNRTPRNEKDRIMMGAAKAREALLKTDQ